MARSGYLPYLCTHTEQYLRHTHKHSHARRAVGIAWNFCADHLILHIHGGDGLFFAYNSFSAPASHVRLAQRTEAETIGPK